MNFETWFQEKHPGIPPRSAAAVLALGAEGGTVPFIARYRKEATGGLDEVAVLAVLEAKETWDEVVKRQAFVVGEIEAQGKLTPELKARLLATFDLPTLEDLYLPYKKKRKTKAVIAREAGLQPLADWLWDVGHGVVSPLAAETPEAKAAAFLNPEAGFRRGSRGAPGGRRDRDRAPLGDGGAPAVRPPRGVRAGRPRLRRRGRSRSPRASTRCTSTSATPSPR